MIWKTLMIVIALTSSVLNGREVCGNKTCNICDCPKTLVNNDGKILESTLCDFEIKYKLTYPPGELVGVGFEADTAFDGFPSDVVICDEQNMHTIQRFFSIQDSVPIKRLDIADVECNNGVMELDIYRPIIHLRDSDETIPMIILDNAGKVTKFNQVIN